MSQHDYQHDRPSVGVYLTSNEWQTQKDVWKEYHRLWKALSPEQQKAWSEKFKEEWHAVIHSKRKAHDDLYEAWRNDQAIDVTQPSKERLTFSEYCERVRAKKTPEQISEEMRNPVDMDILESIRRFCMSLNIV